MYMVSHQLVIMSCVDMDSHIVGVWALKDGGSPNM